MKISGCYIRATVIKYCQKQRGEINMNFFMTFLKGIFIGAAAIAPGVSGGALAVMMGIYERLTDVIANILKYLREDFKGWLKNNIPFFLPLGLGGVAGLLIFSRAIEYLFEHHEIEVKYLFIGLILGTFPLLVKEANKKNGFRKKNLVPFLLSFIITIAVTMSNITHLSEIQGEPGIIELIISGVILGFGTLVPGISASLLLMYAGMYQTTLSSIANIDILTLVPIGIGFVLSIVIAAKLVNYLFKKAYTMTSYTILGFVAGSIFPIFPGFAMNVEHIICAALLAAGFCGSYILGTIHKPSHPAPEADVAE